MKKEKKTFPALFPASDNIYLTVIAILLFVILIWGHAEAADRSSLIETYESYINSSCFCYEQSSTFNFKPLEIPTNLNHNITEAIQ